MREFENILERIEKALDTVRPFLKDDGGDVEVVELSEDLTLKLRLVGNCSTCPQNFMTFKSGIETALQAAVPELKKVIPLNFFPEYEPATADSAN